MESGELGASRATRLEGGTACGQTSGAGVQVGTPDGRVVRAADAAMQRSQGTGRRSGRPIYELCVLVVVQRQQRHGVVGIHDPSHLPSTSRGMGQPQMTAES